MVEWPRRWKVALAVVAVLLVGVAPWARGRATEVASLASALVALVAARLVMRWRLRAANRRLEEHQAGTLSGERLELDGDPEPCVVTGAPAAGARVLVRRRDRGSTGYRSTRAVAAKDIVAVDPATVLVVAELQAVEALRIGVWLAIAGTTTAAVEAVSSWLGYP